MSTFHLYGIGAALVDTEIEVTDTDLKNMGIDKGVMTLVDSARQDELLEHLSDHLIASKRASGGSAANTVIAASYFGASTFYSCKVANDDNGLFYLNDLQDAGVEYHRDNELEAGVTGKCLVMITPDAERTMNTHLGISETVSTNELHPEAIQKSQYAYIEGYLVSSETGRAAAIALRQQAEQANVKTALSLSDPAMVEFFRDGLMEMIGDGVDLLFCNEAEAMGFTQTDSIEAAGEALKQYTNAFAITLGSKGALVFDGENYITIAPRPVTAVDSNGAGDMFAGAFLYAISQGHGFEKAGKLASHSAAQVVSQFGPRLRPEQHAELLQQAFA
ncbi:MAG: adenosine kinase [Candidatus Pelagadaptatus aseana]|uniref:adenosine kinase n=1 Tax=Candidatus Pelagadaptatus aseana TaxID=3120508 RepID=UPI0039B261EB